MAPERTATALSVVLWSGETLRDSPFHPDAEVARIVGCEWRQEVRQQLLCAEPVDHTGWTGLCPAVVLFEVAPCPAALGCDVDYAVNVLHGFSFPRAAARARSIKDGEFAADVLDQIEGRGDLEMTGRASAQNRSKSASEIVLSGNMHLCGCLAASSCLSWRSRQARPGSRLARPNTSIAQSLIVGWPGRLQRVDCMKALHLPLQW
jgi:hypothetical protein